MSIATAPVLALVTAVFLLAALITFSVWMTLRWTTASRQASIDELLRQRQAATARLRGIFRDEEADSAIHPVRQSRSGMP